MLHLTQMPKLCRDFGLIGFGCQYRGPLGSLLGKRQSSTGHVDVTDTAEIFCKYCRI